MNMSIQHNLAAMNASGQYKVTTGNRAKSTEKLSSGYRVNRAADDAAGLAISEKMRRQIKGLNQASRNIQDGISLCQVADGALNETQDICQRINQLALQSANGTNSQEDREYLQQEVSDLIDEVDRIATQTSFNEEIYPLHSTDKLEFSITVQEVTKTYQVTDGSDPDKSYEPVTLQGLILGELSTIAYKGQGVSKDQTELSPQEADNLKSLKIDDLGIDEEGVMYAEELLNTGESEYKRGYFLKRADGLLDAVSLEFRNQPDKIDDFDGTGWSWIKATKIEEKGIYIQAGVEAGHGIDLKLVDATAGRLGIGDIDISTQSGAAESIDRVKSALEKISRFRSDFGAQQNRLEHAIRINDNTAENTQYAESQIRDTDMAEEMVQYSNLGILEQAGVSVLSQANQARQGLLSLLQ